MQQFEAERNGRATAADLNGQLEASLLERGITPGAPARTDTPESSTAGSVADPATTTNYTGQHNKSQSRPPRRGSNSKELVLTPGRELEQARFMPVMDIAQAVARRQLIVDATQKLMKPQVDYGKIPGIDRDVLLQPGADKLCNLFGLTIQYEVTKSVEDWSGEDHGGVPFFFYEIKARAYRGEYLMGEGMGSCHAWESKYKYRKGERVCPQCSKPNIRKSRDGGWFCWAKTGGCGSTFPDGHAAIEQQPVGRILNPDLLDCVNTVLKMALKRAKISATINATGASEFFTQDVEDAPPAENPDSHGFTIDTGNAPYGTRAAQEHVRDQKLARANRLPEDLPSKMVDIKQAFQQIRESLGETRYFEELQLAGVRDPGQFKSYDIAKSCYKRMLAIVRLQREVA